MIPVNTANRISSVKEYYFSKKLREIATMNQKGAKVINLGIGSPDRPPHPEVIKELCAASEQQDTHGYAGYKGIPELRTAFAEWYQKYYDVTLDPNSEILPLIGSKEGIMHISMSFLNRGDQVLVPNPGYPTYRSATELAGGTCIEYNLTEESDWRPNWEELEKKDLSAVKIMWINYPHMPTGTPGQKKMFEELVDFAKRNKILLCHDNPYSFILPPDDPENPEPLSIFAVSGSKEVAIELNSLSKSHNMAGWRLGMMTANAQILEEIMKFKSNMDSGMFVPVQRAAVKALALERSWYAEINAEYAKRREKVKELLNLLNCTYTDFQQGMFMWAKIPSVYKDGYELSDEILYNAQVFITPGGIFGSNGEKYIRISLCSTTENIESAIQRIKENRIS